MLEISTAGIFQVAFIAKQMEQSPQALFQTTFEPIGKVCAARHARGGLRLQGKWKTCACVPHTPYHAGYGLLNPNSHPVLSPRGRELERGQQAARLVFGRLRCWERLPQFGECPLPGPPPREREQVAGDLAISGNLKGNLGLQLLIAGRLKSKKQPAQPVFLQNP